ncbi:MAG: UDP-glucuronic acid decarboxylase family protein [Acidimicrobiia bacterium]
MTRAVVTGGAGFLGSHLCDALRARDCEVVAVDNLITGRLENVAHLADDSGFTLIEHDVIEGIPVTGAVDAVLHLASPASPPEYLAHPIATLEVGAVGTRHALDLAHAHGARFLLASTSEIYGDPLVHPQPESYFGNVNSVGPRAVYDEAKRYAEAITMAYHRLYALEPKIVRIFNSYGPRLGAADGRVVSNFLAQAMAGRPLTIFGDGLQTRSFCYVDDEIRGILALLDSDHVGPMNIGNPDEFTMLELAEIVQELTGSQVDPVFEPLPDDDPKQRRPDISLARRLLGWSPTVDLREGLARTHDWYRRHGGTT